MLITKEFLELEYVQKKKTMQQIGDEIGFSQSCISYWIRKYKIPTNPRIPPNIKNLEGCIFSKLTVLERNGSRKRKAVWICKCECGKITSVTSRSLLSGHSTSCGCNKIRFGRLNPAFKGHEELGGIYVSQIRNGALSRNLIFDVTTEFLWNLFLKQDKKCALSGVDITMKNKGIRGTASLDRIDSLKDYTEDNIQWVHKCVNTIKWNLSQEDFINWCAIVTDYNRSKLPVKI